jgi:hypothetical protein
MKVEQVITKVVDVEEPFCLIALAESMRTLKMYLDIVVLWLYGIVATAEPEPPYLRNPSSIVVQARARPAFLIAMLG